MKASLFSVAFAFVLASQAVFGDELSGFPVEVPVDDDALSDAPVEAPILPEETGAPSPSPTFKQGDPPVQYEPGDIDQPVFEAPVAPPPISEADRIDGAAWMVTSAAIALAAAL